MPENRQVKEFVEGLEQIDQIADAEAELVDEVLARMLCGRHDFPFDWEMRNTMVDTLKESRKVLINYPLSVYVEALIQIIWAVSENPSYAVRSAFIVGMVFEYLTEVLDNAGDGEEGQGEAGSGEA